MFTKLEVVIGMMSIIFVGIFLFTMFILGAPWMPSAAISANITLIFGGTLWAFSEAIMFLCKILRKVLGVGKG